MKDIRPTTGDTSWLVKDRFGLFIHWGLYALGARHEWLKNNEEIPNEVYDDKYFRHFDPDLYDPAVWAEAAAGAGMKYFVVTTKHHEGFCLWDSKLTDYKAASTPAGRDLLAPMVDAFRAKDMRVGFYHSLLDWHHPQYVIDPHVGPYRNLPAEERAKMNEGRDQAKYAEYLHGQVRELLTEYGDIDIMWFDFSYTNRGPEGKGRKDWQSEKLIKLVRELRPGIILNDRLDVDDAWDVKTPEQFQPRSWVTVDGQRVVWGYPHDPSRKRPKGERPRPVVWMWEHGKAEVREIASDAYANMPAMEMIPSDRAREQFPNGTPVLSRKITRNSITLGDGFVAWIEEWNVLWHVPAK